MKVLVVIWVIAVTIGAVFGYFAVIDNNPLDSPSVNVLEGLSENQRQELQELQERAKSLYPLNWESADILVEIELADWPRAEDFADDPDFWEWHRENSCIENTLPLEEDKGSFEWMKPRHGRTLISPTPNSLEEYSE